MNALHFPSVTASTVPLGRSNTSGSGNRSGLLVPPENNHVVKLRVLHHVLTLTQTSTTRLLRFRSILVSTLI